MDESTQTETAQDTPRGYGYCSWHQRFAEDVRLIHLTAASTAGKVHYACPPCIGIFKLTPYADQA